MNKSVVLGIGAIIAVAALALYFYVPSEMPAPAKMPIEDQAAAVIEEELERAVANMTDEDLEALLVQ